MELHSSLLPELLCVLTSVHQLGLAVLTASITDHLPRLVSPDENFFTPNKGKSSVSWLRIQHRVEFLQRIHAQAEFHTVLLWERGSVSGLTNTSTQLGGIALLGKCWG